jgi:hypothetical protein
MLITNARDFLDDKGALAPLKGAALRLAEFHGAVISWATDYAEIGLPKPNCPKCKSAIQVTRGLDDAIVWRCPGCDHEGRISHWQGTLWDMEDRPERTA